MKTIEKKKLSYISFIRFASILFPFAAAAVRLVFYGEVTLIDLQLDLLLACSAIFTVFFIKEVPLLGAALISFILIYGLFNAFLPFINCGKAGKAAFSFMFFLILTVPHPLCILAGMLKNMKDSAYIYASVSGPELMLNRMRNFLALIYQPLALAAFFFIISDIISYVITILLLGLSLIFYVLLSIRSVTGFGLIESGKYDKKYSCSKERGYISFRKPDADNGYKVLFERMREKMSEDKLFLSPSFSVDELSRALYTNRGYLSRMINSCTGMNFNMLMNDYRVHYAMGLFRTNPKMKVSELMELSGFNNPVTFNNAFKLIMNVTPGEWCNSFREELTRSAKQGKNDLSSSSEPPL